MSRFFKRLRIQDVLTIAGILVVTALGLSLLSRALTLGVWAYSDSTEYIVSARMLVAGRGLGIPAPDGSFMPLSLHPPLYPLVISLFFISKINPLDALPVLNMVLFATTILISGALIYYVTRDPLLAISSSVLIILPPTILNNFDGAMTEPLYFPLSIIGTILLAWYWQKGSRRLILAAGIITGLAGLVRYTGLSLLAAGLVIILLYQQPFRQRLNDAAVFSALGAGPLLGWFIYLYSQSGKLASRSVSVAADLGEKIFLFRKGLMDSIVKWVPYLNDAQTWSQKAHITYAIIGIGVLLAGFLFWRASRKGTSRTPDVDGGLKLMVTMLISAAAYLAFVAVSYLFSSITPDINDRILAPLLPLFMIFLCSVLFLAPRVFGLRRIYQIAPMIVILVIGQFYTMQSISAANDSDMLSRGYNAIRWRNSALMEEVKNLPADQPLISNMPVPVLLYTNRFPYSIQELELSQAQVDLLAFGDGSDPVQELFREKGAALIIFQPEFKQQLYEFYWDNAANREASFLDGLKPIGRTNDGAIYIYP